MPYPGGKNGAGVYQRIISMMPPHTTYIEPFLGGGAIMRLKRPAAVNIGLDLSRAAVKTVTAALAIPGDKRSRIARSDGGCRAASSLTAIRSSSPFPAILPATSPQWTIRPGCGLSFLEALPPAMQNPNTLVYCDPPYLLSTRSSTHHLYEYEMADVDHRRLLRWVRTTSCRVMISGYWSAMYGSHLRKWRCTRFMAMTRGGLAEECLWCNFPEPIALHDYRYLGGNFRERERIKRRKTRWTNRLTRMPLLERRALLCAIADTNFFGDGGSTTTISSEPR